MVETSFFLIWQLLNAWHISICFSQFIFILQSTLSIGIFCPAVKLFLKIMHNNYTLFDIVFNIFEFNSQNANYKLFYKPVIGVTRSRKIKSDSDYQKNKERVQELKVL